MTRMLATLAPLTSSRRSTQCSPAVESTPTKPRLATFGSRETRCVAAMEHLSPTVSEAAPSVRAIQCQDGARSTGAELLGCGISQPRPASGRERTSNSTAMTLVHSARRKNEESRVGITRQLHITTRTQPYKAPWSSANGDQRTRASLHLQARKARIRAITTLSLQ